MMTNPNQEIPLAEKIKEGISDGFRSITVGENKKCSQKEFGKECGYFCLSCQPKFERLMFYHVNKNVRASFKKILERIDKIENEYGEESISPLIKDLREFFEKELKRKL